MHDGLRVQGIVLAGVHAWGESALEQVCPRPLLPVVGRPLVWYVLDWLSQAGIRQASICANSDTGIFRRCLGRGTPDSMELDYYADLMPRGPAGCVRDAAAADADVLVVVEASVATQIDLAALLASHRQARAALTAVVTGPSGQEPAGVYVLSREAMKHIPTKGYQDIKEMLIPALYAEGEAVLAWSADACHSLRVRDAASYLAANSWALEGVSPVWAPPAGYRPVGQAYIHQSAEVARTARLVGAVVVGPRCRIGDGATIVGTTTLGSDCQIGEDAVVSRTALWTRCHVEAGAIVDHCVLAQGARVEAASVMRDTVCVPEQAPVLDIARNFWAMVPQRWETPNVLDLMLAAERIKPVPGAERDSSPGSAAAGHRSRVTGDGPRKTGTTTTTAG